MAITEEDGIYGGGGGDEIHGGTGHDALFGTAGGDALFGDEGDDYLEGGTGGDWIDGGADRDQVTYEHSAFGVIFKIPWVVNGQRVFVGSGPAGSDAVGDTLLNVEYIIGSQFKDEIYGNPNQANTLEGLAGNDTLTGGTGNDFLIGGIGRRRRCTAISARTAPPISPRGIAVYIDLLFGNGAWRRSQEGDTLSSIEDVQGSKFDDRAVRRSLAQHS